jgi:hypothetical protein
MVRLSLLPERVERVLPERHETVTFCMIVDGATVEWGDEIASGPVLDAIEAALG